MTPEEEAELKRVRRGRNLVLGGVLVFFAILFYMITLVKIAN